MKAIDTTPMRRLLAALIGLTLTGASVAQAAISGAIFTSTEDGLSVNKNIYDDCEDVYLNGGPQNQNANGLPPGTYYFQVTDPSGGTLLSTDDIAARQVVVNADGRISGVPDIGGPYHAEGSLNVNNGSTPVQLSPFDETPNPGGEHKAWLTPVDSYIADWETNPDAPHNVFGFVPSETKTDNFKCRTHDDDDPDTYAIGGIKYYDANANGEVDQGEVTIEGWQILVHVILPDLTEDDVVTYTDENGEWALVFPEGTSYTVTEGDPIEGDWFQSGPTVGDTAGGGAATAVAIGSGVRWEGTVGTSDIDGLDFLNFCIGEGGGHTLGYWSNKNGQAKMNDNGSNAPELALLVSRNLRNANGTHFDPANYAAFRTWLLGAKATNMAYMLSAQMAAMLLNVESGNVDDTSLIYDVENNEVVTIADLLDEANTELGLHGLTTTNGADSAFRALQRNLKDLLDDANNNLNFIQTEPCPFTFAP